MLAPFSRGIHAATLLFLRGGSRSYFSGNFNREENARASSRHPVFPPPPPPSPLLLPPFSSRRAAPPCRRRRSESRDIDTHHQPGWPGAKKLKNSLRVGGLRHGLSSQLGVANYCGFITDHLIRSRATTRVGRISELQFLHRNSIFNYEIFLPSLNKFSYLYSICRYYTDSYNICIYVCMCIYVYITDIDEHFEHEFLLSVFRLIFTMVLSIEML